MKKAITFLAFLLFLFTNKVEARQFAGGDGSSVNPWQITTPSQLDSIRWFSGDHFILMNDIDLSFETGYPDGQFWNDGKGWERIGPFDDGGFEVNFDGNGKIISGIIIDGGEFYAAGLFGYLINSSIKNLGLKDINYQFDSLIPNYTGGIVGIANNTNISSCFTHGEIEAHRNTGGLVGDLTGTIENSYTKVEMTGFLSQNTGGLVALITGQINNSYSLGYSNKIGFEAGEENGPLVADPREVTINSSRFNRETTGFDNHEYGISNNTNQMLITNSFNGWNFSDEGEWSIVEGTTYPYLKWQTTPETFNYPSYIGVSLIEGNSKPTSVDISWTEPSFGNPIGYNVYTYEKYNGEPVQENSLNINTDSAGVLNFYYVRTVYVEDGDTVLSNESDFVKLYSGFASGIGTENSPYGINDVNQLQLISITWSEFFELEQDIDASDTRTWNEGQGFEPIPGMFREFSGVLNGNGYKIDSLFINRPEEDYVGLFTRILCCRQDAVFDLALTNANVVGKDNVGILAGDNSGYISKIYATGTVSGRENVGGIVGISQNDNYDTYADVDVAGIRNVGGITGYAVSSDFGFHYSLGQITGNENVGGVVGYVRSPTSFDDPVYWNIETSAIDTSAIGMSLSSSQMRQKSTFDGFDFVNIWEIINGFSFPFLKSNRQNPLPGFINPYTFGDGTESNPYQITSNQELNNTRFLLEDHFILMNDLDLTFDTQNSDGEFWNNGKGWRPIGEMKNPFQGSLDGNNYTITGLKINDTANSNALFSYNGRYGIIQNLKLDSVSIKGNNRAGAVVSDNFGLISRVSVQGTLTGFGITGGIVGNNREEGIIRESSFKGIVISEYLLAGGLVGDNRGMVSDSYVIADVSNLNNIGGPPQAGGVIGYGYEGTISNSFFVGTLKSSTQTGGIVGNNINTTFENMYWDTEVSGVEIGAGIGSSDGMFGLTTEQMANQNSFENWDFESTWVMQPEAESPSLRWNADEIVLPIPDSVTLIYPAQNEWFAIFEAEFIWSSSKNAEIYELELANDSLFQLIVYETESADTSISLQDGILQADEEYFWRVLAKNENGESSWSEVFRFTGNGGLSNEENGGVPTVFALSQNYPNPFNPSTTIKFDLPKTEEVSLRVFDMLGREVAILIKARIQAGYHEIKFNASSLASGMYIYRIEAGEFISTRKMLLVK